MPVCAECNSEIIGRVITADNRSYHPDHFICGWCKTPLVLESYYTIENTSVCQACRNKEKCSSCGFLITETKYVKVDDKLWHEDCFRCEECDAELFKFHNIGDLMYCPPCFAKKTGTTSTSATGTGDNFCAGCNTVLSGDVLKAMNKRWHERCFVCTNCRGPFPDDEFVRVNDRPYCDKCAGNAKKSLTALSPDLKNIHTQGRSRDAQVVTNGNTGSGPAGAGAGAGAGARGVGAGAGAGGAGGAAGTNRGGAGSGNGGNGYNGANVVGQNVPAPPMPPVVSGLPMSNRAGNRNSGAVGSPANSPANNNRKSAMHNSNEIVVDDPSEFDVPEKPSQSKYANRNQQKFATNAEQEKKGRDYKSKPVVGFGGETDHLNELDNFQFSMKKK